jgi:hypothetical protein
MLNDKERKEVCLQRMKAAYNAGFKGNAEVVLDGTAEAILRTKYGDMIPTEAKKRKRDVKEKGQRRIDVFVMKERGKPQ